MENSHSRYPVAYAHHSPNDALVYQDLEVAVREVVLMNTVPPVSEKGSWALHRPGRVGPFYIFQARIGTRIPVGALMDNPRGCVWVAHRPIP